MDHVPPKVLFGGARRSNMIPDIITVPSCCQHNAGASGDDEVLARILAHAAIHRSCSVAATDVFFALMAKVNKRIHNGREFADSRLASIGVRVLRQSSDYDEFGTPKPPSYDAAYLDKTAQHLQEQSALINRELVKIVAGLWYKDRGQPLGLPATKRMSVFVPDFKQISSEAITVQDLGVDESAYFAEQMSWSAPPWRPLSSGSPEVFKCDVASHPLSRSFAIRMLFYGVIRAWVILVQVPCP